MSRAGATPLDPDAAEARRWLQDELSKAEYRNSEPTPFDLATQAIREWFEGLFAGATGLPGPLVLALVVSVVAALVIVGLLVFGVPRLRRRRAESVPLFDDQDRRDLDTLRSAASAAAAVEEWPLAIEERFRAVVRGLVQRDLIRVHPGTTARGVAGAAAGAFRDESEALHVAAADFDAVRYLGRGGSHADYDRMTALERRLDAAAPATVAPAVFEAPR